VHYKTSGCYVIVININVFGYMKVIMVI